MSCPPRLVLALAVCTLVGTLAGCDRSSESSGAGGVTPGGANPLTREAKNLLPPTAPPEGLRESAMPTDPNKDADPNHPKKPKPPTRFTYVAPPDWRKQTSPDAACGAWFILPRADGDPTDGELAAACKVAAPTDAAATALAQVRAQFSADDGGALPDGDFRSERLTSNGLTITLFEARGRYTPAGPSLVADPSPKPGYAAIGAVVESPIGVAVFRAAGPQATMAKHRTAILEFVKGIRVE